VAFKQHFSLDIKLIGIEYAATLSTGNAQRIEKGQTWNEHLIAQSEATPGIAM